MIIGRPKLGVVLPGFRSPNSLNSFNPKFYELFWIEGASGGQNHGKRESI